jgi:hypothetical protein
MLTKEKIKNILDLGDNSNSVHDAPILDRNQNEAIILLAEKIDELTEKIEKLNIKSLRKN